MKTAQQQQAKNLYFNSNKTIREIAAEVDVDERTLYRWARKEAWDKLRQAALVAPAIAVENMFSQLLKLQKFIAGRGEDFQFPTIQEAEITRKLVNCITQMNKYLELGMNIRVRSGFLDYVEFTDFDMAMKLAKYSDSYFMDEKSEYKPYPWHNLEQQQAENESKMSDEQLIVTRDISLEEETETFDNEEITVKDSRKTACHQPDKTRHSEVEIDISEADKSTKAEPIFSHLFLPYFCEKPDILNR